MKTFCNNTVYFCTFVYTISKLHASINNLTQMPITLKQHSGYHRIQTSTLPEPVKTSRMTTSGQGHNHGSKVEGGRGGLGTEVPQWGTGHSPGKRSRG